MIIGIKGGKLSEVKLSKGRPRIGKKLFISVPDEIIEFIASERRLAESVVGAAPSEADMIRTLLDRARKSVELERSLEQIRNCMDKKQ